MTRAKDITGSRFRRLIAIRPDIRTRRGTRWLCRCDCGNTAYAWLDDLLKGRKKDCGCHGRPRAEARRRTLARVVARNIKRLESSEAHLLDGFEKAALMLLRTSIKELKSAIRGRGKLKQRQTLSDVQEWIDDETP